jgi:predicted nucleotidyltransferase
MDPDAIPRTALRQVAARHPALRLLLVHGSRARGDEHVGSDWDLGYLADGPLDVGRVAARLPSDAAALRPATDATDAVILHLWQAVQVVIDVAVSSCVTLGLGRRRPTATRSVSWPPTT